MYTLVIVLYVIVSLVIIGLVMVQHGKGADAASTFGGGASSTVFGAGGSGSFLSRLTTVCAAIFFVLSLLISNMNTHKANEPKKSGWADIGITQLVNPEVQQLSVGKDIKLSKDVVNSEQVETKK